VQAAFETVVWVVCGVGVVIGVVALVRTGKTWDEYGKHALVMDRDLQPTPSSGSAASTAERDDEIRQLLEARNARRARRGEPPLDVEQELRRLLAPRVDDQMRAEIRELVVARNYRRARLGKPPLDVEAEVERQISELPSA
jgi:hypothetical protein